MQKNWWQKLKDGVGKTTQQVQTGLKVAVGLSAKLDGPTREALEETLLQADVGLAESGRILDDLQRLGLSEPLTEEALKAGLAQVIAARLAPWARPFDVAEEQAKVAGPLLVLVAGVNGGGKTTTIGKLAARWAAEGHRVIVAAADTFRAGAVAQLSVWAERGGARGDVRIVQSDKPGGDPAGVAYAAFEQAQRDGYDVVLVDTAGRLPNRADLMAELAKIRRVVQKLDETAPHRTLLVLDGTQGQATLSQVRAFREQGAVDGLIVTKLDGSAKAGFLLPLVGGADALPIHLVGVGEGLDDLGDFDAEAFAKGLVGLE